MTADPEIEVERLQAYQDNKKKETVNQKEIGIESKNDFTVSENPVRTLTFGEYSSMPAPERAAFYQAVLAGKAQILGMHIRGSSPRKRGRPRRSPAMGEKE